MRVAFGPSGALHCISLYLIVAGEAKPLRMDVGFGAGRAIRSAILNAEWALGSRQSKEYDK